MSRLRSRLQRLERQASQAGTRSSPPEDVSWLFEPYLPPPNPVEVLLEKAAKGNFISLEQAKAMIANGEVVSGPAETMPLC